MGVKCGRMASLSDLVAVETPGPSEVGGGAGTAARGGGGARLPG